MRHAVLAAALLFSAATPAAAQTWLADTTRTIPGNNTGWSTMEFSPKSGRLFIARQDDGLLVWDPKTQEGGTVPDTKGAAAIVLVPEIDRAYLGTTDGAVITIDLKTLKPVDRIDGGIGDIEQGVYEPTQKRVHFISGARPEKTVWLTLNAATGRVVGKTEFNARKMDAPAVDAEGWLYAPVRDRGLLQQLHPDTLAIRKTWKLGDCQLPVAVEWEPATKRVLVACRGDKPVFVALDPAAGIVATIPIGRGADGMVLDRTRRLIVTANGTDGSMSIIRENGPNDFALVETTSTRPLARVLAIDPATSRLFTATATATQPAPTADKKDPPVIYQTDSFSILTYRANTP